MRTGSRQSACIHVYPRTNSVFVVFGVPTGMLTAVNSSLAHWLFRFRLQKKYTVRQLGCVRGVALSIREGC